MSAFRIHTCLFIVRNLLYENVLYETCFLSSAVLNGFQKNVIHLDTNTDTFLPGSLLPLLSSLPHSTDLPTAGNDRF